MPIVSVTRDAIYLHEGLGFGSTYANLVFTREKGVPSNPLTIDYTLGGNASPEGASGDYTANPDLTGSLTFAANQTQATIAITVVDDDDQEAHQEKFSVTLTDGAAYDVNPNASKRTFLIVDDDQPPMAITTCNCSCNCGGGVTAQNAGPGGAAGIGASLGAAVGSQMADIGAATVQSGDAHLAVMPHALEYSSDTNGKVLLSEDTAFGEDIDFATTISSTVNMISGGTNYYDPSTGSEGVSYRFTHLGDFSSLPSGLYPYQMIVQASGDGWSEEQNINNIFIYDRYVLVVNRNDSILGSNWFFKGMSQLFVQTEGAMLAGDNGQALWFPFDGTDYELADGDLSEAVLAVISGGYQLTDKWGNYRTFNGDGAMTSFVTTDGNATTYSYTGDFLDSVTDFAGRTTTFSYTSGLLSSVTDPYGRVTTLTHDGGKLESITLPDPDGAGSLAAPVTQFLYTDDKLTTITNSDSDDTTLSYGYDGTLDSIVFPGSETRYFDPALRGGAIIGPGTYGTLVKMAALVPSSTVDKGKERDGLNRDTYRKTDRHGQPTEITDPNGKTTTYTRDSDGRPMIVTAPDPDDAGPESAPVTEMTYDTDGNLTDIEYPDGSTESWTYGTLNRPTQHTDPRGKVTLFNHNSTTGLLTSETRSLAASTASATAKRTIWSRPTPIPRAARATRLRGWSKPLPIPWAG
jgi:YD repeat-containing protein